MNETPVSHLPSKREKFVKLIRNLFQDPFLSKTLSISLLERERKPSNEMDPDLYLDTLKLYDREHLKFILGTLSDIFEELKLQFPFCTYFVQAVGSTVLSAEKRKRDVRDLDLRIIIDDPEQREEAIEQYIKILRSKLTSLELKFKMEDHTGTVAQGSYFYDYNNSDIAFFVNFGLDTLPIHISIASPDSFTVSKYAEAERKRNLPRSVLFGNVDAFGELITKP